MKNCAKCNRFINLKGNAFNQGRRRKPCLILKNSIHFLEGNAKLKEKKNQSILNWFLGSFVECMRCIIFQNKKKNYIPSMSRIQGNLVYKLQNPALI